MILYRYLSAAHVIQALQNTEWKLGRTKELNDPADFRPPIVEATLGSSAKLSPEDSSLIRGKFLEMVDNFWGVLCFSSIFNDPVIWSHYADHHRGIVLGFEFNGEFPYRPFEISYSDSVVKLNTISLAKALSSGAPDAIHAEMAKAFGNKAASWEYEKEWRCLVPLDHVDCAMKGHHVFAPLPHLKLREVLLGVRCTLHPVDIYRSFRQWSNCNQIEISRMRGIDDSFLLRKERYDIRPAPVVNEAEVTRLFNVSAEIDGKKLSP